MTNILKAVINFANYDNSEIGLHYKNKIRIQKIGDSLEYFIKDIFSGTKNMENLKEKETEQEKCFSYLGNANNPPDIMILGGDAIEVKKIENKSKTIALNSSFPKHKLFADDPLITEACRSSEKWVAKDIIYTIGHLNNSKLLSLTMVYGNCFCADRGVYQRVKNTITNGVNNIEGVEFSETNELARVNKVDPLGVTYLRVRGMWGIEHPNSIFKYISDFDKNKLNVLLLKCKYDSLPYSDREAIEKDHRIIISDVEIKNPNNPIKKIQAKYIFIVK